MLKDFAEWFKRTPSFAAPKNPSRQYLTFGSALLSDIPIIIPCFDLVTYTAGIVNRLQKFGLRNIILVDNGSTYPPMLDYLCNPGRGVTVVRDGRNNGPRHAFECEIAYSSLPEYFCITDPDLQLHNDLPSDFISQLIFLTEKHKIGKAGLALDISDKDLMVTKEFKIGQSDYSIWDWEIQFWKEQIDTTPVGNPVFKALIDTTFALYNKKYFVRDDFLSALRVGGNFTCKHLPWYVNNGLSPDEERWYRHNAKHSYYLSNRSPRYEQE